MEDEAQFGAGLSFRLDPEKKALIASVQPDSRALPIDEAWLRARIAELGYGALRYVAAAGTVLLGRYNAGAAVAALAVAECVDARIEISIAADGLEAYLNIAPAQGGEPVSAAEVIAGLAEKHVTTGILEQAIAASIAAGMAERVVIARGTAAVHGRDGYLESLVPNVRNRVPRVSESGTTDYRDLGEIFVVQPGDALMLRHPATAGSTGQTVLGAALAPKAGKDVMFAANLSGIRIDPDNPDRLLAAIAGQPVLVKAGMNVDPIFRVDEVGLASGNIDFDGSVVIHGDVAAGMTVRATGDIEVGGMAEAATLEAGGSVVIKGGVVGDAGRKEGEGHRIRCGGSFSAAYVQKASIEAGDSIFIDDVAMQSELSAVNHVRVGNQKRGHIIGGKTRATLSVTARVIGSPNRVATFFEIGVNPGMHKLLLDMAEKRDGKETQLLEVSKLLDFAAHHPGKIRPDMVDKARQTAAALSAEIAEMRDEQEALTQKIALSQEAKVIVEQAMHEGVEVHLGKFRYRVPGERGAGAIGLDKHGLALLPAEEGP